MRIFYSFRQFSKNIESLYVPYLFKENSILHRLILRNSKIYKKSKKFIKNPPADLKLIQIAPKLDLSCGVLSANKNKVLDDYRYGLEIGLDSLNQLEDI